MTNGATARLQACAAEELEFWGVAVDQVLFLHEEGPPLQYDLEERVVSEPELKAEASELWREAHELHPIFSRIWRSTKL